jgi:hypothetical protein
VNSCIQVFKAIHHHDSQTLDRTSNLLAATAFLIARASALELSALSGELAKYNDSGMLALHATHGFAGQEDSTYWYERWKSVLYEENGLATVCQEIQNILVKSSGT